jgi:hypothetical protein
MWVGVERGLAGVKFSGSIKEKGNCIKIKKKRNTNNSALVISLNEK